jgi:hypothetical protein
MEELKQGPVPMVVLNMPIWSATMPQAPQRAMTESILITATIDAKQKRDLMTADIPNAFVQTAIDEKNHIKGEHIIMKIRGPLVDMLLEIAPDQSI